MPMTDGTKNYLAQAIRGEAITPFNNANAYIGVGNSSAGFDGSHTDLQGTSVRRGMRPGYPSRNDNVLIYTARFEEEVANFNWNEAGIFNDSSGGVMLNRLIDAMGNKTSSEIWDLEITLTILRGT